MCCFSGKVDLVKSTRIFARPTYADRQVVVYEMEFAAKKAVAMILPLPVKRGIDPKEFKFISLEAYPAFFQDMEKGFPPPIPPPAVAVGRGAVNKAPLEVVSVGSFEASFVPTLEDFDRLDPRFRIDAKIWRSLPGYDAMSFAVFKLKPGRQKVHPMCFAYPRADTGQLFFPTLHIHDGSVHEKEKFDHILYAQGNDEQMPEVHGWQESEGIASQFVKTKFTAGILDNDGHVYRRRLRGELPNKDTYVATT